MEEPLDSRQLRAFVVLAKTGSNTETARQLFVTHSAISHAMRTLESNVGCCLLSNMNKKVIITDAGEALASCRSSAQGNDSGEVNIGPDEQMGVPNACALRLKRRWDGNPDALVEFHGCQRCVSSDVE
jgi:DNA-binding transcriptional LysR family regulator